MGMYNEYVAIITSRVMYIALRPHRFAFNLGYGFDSTDASMTTITMLVTSAFIELIFEGLVDCYALDIEFKNGVDVDEFWKMWKVNPAAFWGMTVCDSLLASLVCCVGPMKRRLL